MKFIPGLRLSERLYHEIVKGLLLRYSPDLRYSAGLIGYGSDVLGFDDETSTDHNWGPRLSLFLEDGESDLAPEIATYLRKNLPTDFCGYSTNFTLKRDDQTQSMCEAIGGEVNHLIEIHGVDRYFCSVLGKGADGLTHIDWLGIPEQKLLELTSGRIFHDGLEKLERYRKALSYYPKEVGKLRLAAYWDCIANEEAFVGRMIESADGIGLRLLTARLITHLMRICFILKKKYCPYSKWFSKSFQNLELPECRVLIEDILAESDMRAVEEKLTELYLGVLRLQNESGDYPVINHKIKNYYGRPYKVIMAGEIVEQLMDSIEDEKLKSLNLVSVALDGKVVSLDFTDSDVLERAIS